MTNQKNLNQEMVDRGVDRYRKSSSISKGSLTAAGRRLMRDAVEPVYLGLLDHVGSLKEFKNKSEWQRVLCDLHDNKLRPLALIGISGVLDSSVEPLSIASLSFRIGRLVEDQLLSDYLISTYNKFGRRIVHRMQNLRHDHTTKSRYLHKTATKENMGWTDWTRRQRIACGSMIIEIIHKRTGLITFTEKTHRKRKAYKPQRMVELSDETRQWIEGYDQHREVLLPFWMPMLESPLPWKSVYGGGYDVGEGDGLPLLPFIRCSNRSVLREAPEMPEVYKAVNTIQETPFRVNGQILNVLEWAWENDKRIGLPPREDIEPPNYLRDDASVDEVRDFRDARREAFAFNRSQRSKRILINRILMLGRKFSDKRLFFPCSLDFRGRVYQIPSFLTYQGPDHCRGLLHFFRGERIKNDDDLKWLAIHGANCFGLDKVSYEKRVEWSDEFTKKAVAIAKDPYSNQDWVDADEPWQFLAWCFEWGAYHTRVTKNFETHLPCAMDATNSGLQLLSLLARDDLGCVATNVAPTDEPQDIYEVVATHTKGKLEQDATQSHKFASKWLEFGMNRKMSKRPVMCYSYGLTPYSNRDYVKQWYFDCLQDRGMSCLFGRRNVYPAIKYLANHLWDSIEEVLTKPRQVMDWFQQVATLKAKENQPITWTAPSGFVVKQDYKQQTSRKVSTWLSGSLSAVRFKDDTDAIDSRKQSNGISPNVIHSLDAAGLVKTVNEAHLRGIDDFAVIHDSYATHSPKCPVLADSIKDSFSAMFSESILDSLASEWKMDGTDVPSVPEFGTFDPELLKQSKYFFS